MMQALRYFWMLLVGGVLWLPDSLQANPVWRDHIEVELVSEQTAITPGTTSRLGLRFLPDEEWHTYWLNPGDSGLPIELSWRAPEGVEVSEIAWPYPQRIEVGHLVNYGFEGEHLLPVTFSWPSDLPMNAPVRITVDAAWLVCKVECIPGEATLSLDLPISHERADLLSDHESLFAWADQRQPQAMNTVGAFKLESDQLSVQLPTEGLMFGGPPSPSQVFVTNANVIDHAKDFFVASGDGVLQLALPLSPFFPGSLDELGVVLIDPVTQKAYAWSAIQGELISTTAADDLAYVWVLLLAFIGGVLLNLMPCVFPVLSIKALHLVQTPSNHHRSHAVAYTLGVLLSFMALATLLMLLRAGGEALGWGFQLQSPWVVSVLIYVMFVMGLSLSGMAELGTRWMGIGQSMADSSTHRGSLISGVLASVVASPCTAPFMGTALGAAVLMPWAMGLGVFFMLGLGLAMPLLVLGFVPALARWLPKPGAWMNTFKQAMAFPLYLAVVWLVWVLARQTDAMAVAYILIGLVALAFSLWLSRLPERHPKLVSVRHTLVALSWLVALAMIASASRSADEPNRISSDLAEPFSVARLEALLADPETAVFVNMTADWCVTCLVNERVALSSEAFAEALRSHNVVYLKGDWTRRDEVITHYLAEFGRNGVPLYVVYPKDGSSPKVLPQILTPDAVISALETL